MELALEPRESSVVLLTNVQIGAVFASVNS